MELLAAVQLRGKLGVGIRICMDINPELRNFGNLRFRYDERVRGCRVSIYFYEFANNDELPVTSTYSNILECASCLQDGSAANFRFLVKIFRDSVGNVINGDLLEKK